MSDVTTPNMGLVLPVIGVSTGFDWETQVNANSERIDDHDHSPGYGVQITTDGLNINSDFSLNGNSLIDVKSVIFTPNVSPLSGAYYNSSIYFSGVDFYVNDANGNEIQLTKNGAVFASSSGISSGTASASFNGSLVLVVNSNTNTPASIQCGSILIGNTGVLNSNYLTLQCASALPGNYSITFPEVPSADNTVMQMNTSGVILNAQVTTTQIASGTITGGNIASATITGSNIASGTITGSNLASGTITGSDIASGTITGSNIASTTISGSNIVNSISLPGNPSANGYTFLSLNTQQTYSVQVIRFKVNNSGTIILGEGVSVSHVSTGVYRVTFTNSFSFEPAITASIFSTGGLAAAVAIISNASGSGCTVNTGTIAGGTIISADYEFYMIVMG